MVYLCPQPRDRGNLEFSKALDLDLFLDRMVSLLVPNLGLYLVDHLSSAESSVYGG